ncbi:MAG TPA: S8 family serine peptidase [Chloroflexota bacterium]|nr:S8 family serine peptidase [Chloroflexota bacterium]
MPAARVRSFVEDEREAVVRPLPVPRGIVFRYVPPGSGDATLAEAEAAVAPVLPEWPVAALNGLPGWFKAMAPAVAAAGQPTAMGMATETATATETRPIPLGEFWERLRAVAAVDGVSDVEPLLLIASPQPRSVAEAEAFALGVGRAQFGLWGAPYDDDTSREIARLRRNPRWHIEQLKVPEAWGVWRAKRAGGAPGDLPGEGIVVAHPDTGYSGHPQVASRFVLPGKSFIAEGSAAPLEDARDDLVRAADWSPEHPEWFLQNPGHGTSTASVIVSAEGEEPGADDVFGVAPGAKVLPLRVSRSVLHLDFDALGAAIRYAVERDADVISMSLGGPFFSGYLRTCIDLALEHGIIVVSAAGNCVPATVFPAAFPEVVGVAALHAAGGPWRFSAIGRLVDVIAPGEDVTCALASHDGDADAFSVGMGTGTSFATACVAGIAALWLSHWGGRAAVAAKLGGRLDLVPFAFQYLLRETANATPDFLRGGSYGKGIPDAAALLASKLPSAAAVERYRREVMGERVNALTFLAGLFTGGRAVTEDGAPTGADGAHEARLIERLLGEQTSALQAELLARVASDRMLLVGFQRWRRGETVLPLIDRLLTPPGGDGTAALSTQLRAQLERARDAEAAAMARSQRGQLTPGVAAPPERGPAPPAFRPLRAYAFDPSLETRLETAHITQVTIPTRWERLAPGPVGEYLEVVDVDPATGCVYAPVDLNHPHVLAQDGLAPSEGSPQFHQQMVYAVAMNTIHRFEVALGRPIFWAPLRPWLKVRPEEERYFTPEALALMERERQEERAKLAAAEPRTKADEEWRGREDRYVRRLRVYPHALREPNAYYSPTKRALLFGYFPASSDDPRGLPGGMVFTCLSHDIIAHETTHALLDGMHPFFNEPSNPDVWAFHEAFADIMALFQHFTYPEVLRHQIANTRGNLETDNLLAMLAQQFGQATGRRAELRNALGTRVGDTFTRNKPDPTLLRTKTDPHGRGSVLVAAVFDAFLELYDDRVADLLRIATGGTGVLPAGSIHPDLVNRLALEAAAVAEEVLRACIRAMDYVPPVDITFGEFLRALITADYDLFAGERRKNRIAFIEAFRSWGIYPGGVPTLSEDSLRWRQPGEDDPLRCLEPESGLEEDERGLLRDLADALEGWQPRVGEAAAGPHGTAESAALDEVIGARGRVFQRVLRAQQGLHRLLERLQKRHGDPPLIPGINLRQPFSIGNLRPARRVGPHGEFRTEMVVEVVQSLPRGDDKDAPRLRGGATLVVDLLRWDVRYVIYKRLYEQVGRRYTLSRRVKAQLEDGEGERALDGELDMATPMGLDTGDKRKWLAATYTCEAEEAERKRRRQREEPFALLHGVAELGE